MKLAKVAYEIPECIRIVGNMKEELGREMVYNNRRDCGNMSASSRFAILWEAWCSFSPLCEGALALRATDLADPNLSGLDAWEKNLVVAVNQADEVIRRFPQSEKEARAHVFQTHERVCVLLEKLERAVAGG